ncbi:MAG TPA: phosphodiester glycosidase family protein [Solirubrobacteraceae bacterium]|nr:phosphodiester glycosidase family protein [Solirubrobacteraceae bacterium]
MRTAWLWEIGRGKVREAAVCAVVAGVLVGGTATAQARSHRDSAWRSDAGDSTGFVHKIQWSSNSPAPGVTLLSGVYSDPSANPYWAVTIQAPVPSPFGAGVEEAEAGSPAWAQQTETSLEADGFDPTAIVLPWPNYADDPRGVMGVRVRVGQFATQAEATTEAATLTADGFAPLVEWTGFDPQPGPDAELLHVAIVDPRRFAGKVIAYHGSAIASRQTVPAASAALDSVAATNGGFFTIDAPLAAVSGVNTGLSVHNGQIESLANGDRADLVLDGRHPAEVENLTSVAVLRSGGGSGRDSRESSIRILGINRLPGSAEDCGVAGFTPTAQPRQNTLCTGANDIVLFTPEFGAPLPSAPSSGPATQAVLNSHGQVVSVGSPGGTLPAGDSAVQAIGTDAAWLSAHAQVGQPLSVFEQLRTASGAPFPLNPQISIASAGPLLLRRGQVDIDAVNEGVLDPRDLNDYTFSAYRHARTFAGVDPRGRLILATADGIPGVSAGLTLTEEADLMRSLGAVDAINLDGGGSTQFASEGQLLNDASSSPLRPVGDTIQVVP